jgi:ribosome-associated translation inhibitor RaiA
MWKQVYIDHQAIHHDSYLAEETLKDQLQDMLKKLKIRTSKEEGSERATLQYDQVLLAHGPLCVF